MLAGCIPWPDELVDRYRREGFWTDEVLGDILDPWLERDGSRPAIVTGSGATTYAQLNGRVHQVAGALQRLGIRQGDRILVQLPNDVDLVAISLASFRLGVMPVFALVAHRRHEIAYLCRHAEPSAYVIPGLYQGFDFRKLADEVRAADPRPMHVISTGDPGSHLSLRALADSGAASFPRIDPAEVAFFLLSGGTTGTPKLIPRTHRDYAFQLRATAQAVRVDSNSTYLAALPVAHNAALGCPGALGTLRAGGKVVLAQNPSPGEIFPLIAREHVTLTTLMPSILKLWVEMAEPLAADLSGVLFQVGGAWLDPQVARKVYAILGARLTHWFGMAEGFLSYTRLDDPQELAVRSTGRPLCTADEIRVVDDADQEVAPAGTGELLVRGPTTLRGYYRAEDYNQKTFTADGYLRTGDLVRIDDSGNMVMEGRIKDVVNRGGEKVPTEELEQYLTMHPGVEQAAVVAVPDPDMVEKTCAFVVAGRNAPVAAELRRFLRDSGLAGYKIPDLINFVDALPHTNLGKVNKRALRERLTAQAAADAAAREQPQAPARSRSP